MEEAYLNYSNKEKTTSSINDWNYYILLKHLTRLSSVLKFRFLSTFYSSFEI